MTCVMQSDFLQTLFLRGPHFGYVLTGRKKKSLNLNVLCNLSPDIGSKTAFDR